MKLAIASLAVLAGCAQILGLDDTRFDRRDAAADAPNVCDTPAFECVATTGRTVCGQLFAAGTGEPYRVANPMAQVCTTTEGPCGLTVSGQSTATLFAGTTADRVMGQVDDCGHFVISDLDATATNVAISISGTDVASSARLLFELSDTTETKVAVVVVPTATQETWATQLAIAQTEIASGYLVSYLTNTGAPVPIEEVRVGGAPVVGPPTRPWAAYFTEADTLDPALTATSAKGTALIASPLTGDFRIGGFHVGKTCGRDGFQTVSNTLIYIVLEDC
ncbi:MAG: hypothetical protein H0T42_01200 [Deltaproteobacteria bacterium]|nr:hypothetical protein [Deltaproteobacteria bacterium]